MGERAPRGMLYVIVCAAPPAAQVQDLVKLAPGGRLGGRRHRHPGGARLHRRAAACGHHRLPVRHRWREPDEPESVPEANAIVVAPATFNTINRWVAGITNTVAVGTLCEFLGLDGPLARHPTFRASLRRLREWGVRVLFDESAPRAARMPPWEEVLEEVNRAHEATGWPPRGTPGTGAAARVDGAAP
jgi:hypothetical protein